MPVRKEAPLNRLHRRLRCGEIRPGERRARLNNELLGAHNVRGKTTGFEFAKMPLMGLE